MNSLFGSVRADGVASTLYAWATAGIRFSSNLSTSQGALELVKVFWDQPFLFASFLKCNRTQCVRTQVQGMQSSVSASDVGFAYLPCNAELVKM